MGKQERLCAQCLIAERWEVDREKAFQHIYPFPQLLALLNSILKGVPERHLIARNSAKERAQRQKGRTALSLLQDVVLKDTSRRHSPLCNTKLSGTFPTPPRA